MSDSFYNQFSVSVKTFLDQSTKDSQKTIEGLKQQATIESSNASLYDQIGTAQTIKVTQEGAAQLQVQNANLAAGRAAGVDPSTGGDLINEQISQLAKTNKDLIASLAKVDEIQNNPELNIFQKAWRSAMAQDGIESKAKLAAAQYQSATQLNTLLDSKFKTNADMKQTLNQDVIDAQVRQTKAAADLQVNDANLKAIQYNLMGISAAQKATSDQMGVLLQATSAQNAQTQLGFAANADKRAAAAEGRAEVTFNLESALRADQVRTVQENRQGEEITLQKYNLGRKTLGLPEKSMGEFKAIKDAWGKGALKNEANYYEIGSKLAEGDPRGLYGENPLKTVDTLTQANVRLAPVANETLNLLKQIRAKMSADQQAQTGGPLADKKENEDARNAYVEKATTAALDGMARKIVPGDQSNLLNFGSLGVYFDKPEFAKFNVVKKVLGPMQASGLNLDNHDTNLNAIASAAKEGKVNLTQAAAEYSEMVQKAYLMNWQARQFAQLGNIKTSGKAAYNVDLRVEDGVSSTATAVMGTSAFSYAPSVQTVDIMDPTKLTHILSQKIANNWSK